MKIQIDTDNKIIRIEEPVNIGEFYEMIQKLFPDNLWKEFKLETNVITNWVNPIVIKEYPIYPVNPYPLYPQPNPFNPPFWITCQTGTHMENGLADQRTTYSLNKGIFNIDCQIQN